MKLKEKALTNLKEILMADYNLSLSDSELNDFGVSLLKITHLSVTALARAEEESSVVARERNFLESNTSM